MKLATYKDGSRDGQLVVVSRDLGQAHFASGIASRLQQVLDDWNFLSPQLEDLFVTLNQGRARHAFVFDARKCMAPLPRAGLWVSGLAGAGGGPPHSAPPLLACPGDDLQGPHDPAWFGLAGADGADLQIDCEAGLVVASGDVARAASPAQALDGVRLLMLAGSWRLRALLADELAAGRPPLQGLAATAFAPVAVTPDELGSAWQGGRLQGRLRVSRGGRTLCEIDTAAGMAWHFGQLLAHLAASRRLCAGALVGSGALRGPDAATGLACIADLRAQEAAAREAAAQGAAAQGSALTPYLAIGESLRIEFKARDGTPVFGPIEQVVAGPEVTAADGAAADSAAAAVASPSAPAPPLPDAPA